MAGPLAFQFLYGTAIRTGYITYPNGCTTGSEGTILQTAFEGESPTPLRITSFSHGGSYWFVLAASDGEPYEIGNSNPEPHGFVAGQVIYVDNSRDDMPTEEFTNIASGALNTGYYTLITGPGVGAGGANVVALYENTDEQDIFVQPTGCNGNLNFSSATYSGKQDSNIEVDITRTKGDTGAVTVTIDAAGGTAKEDTDYTILPTRQEWEDGDSTNKTFTITTVNTFAAQPVTIDLVFNLIVGGFTGTVEIDPVITITNDPVTEQIVNPFPEISSDFTINSYRNLASDYVHKGKQVPFSLGNKGPRTIRNLSSAYSTSLG